MCQFCNTLGLDSNTESDNLPALVGQEYTEETSSFAEFLKSLQNSINARQLECKDTEGRCATHNRISGVWEDYGTWEAGEGYNMASTYSGSTVVQTFIRPDSDSYVTVMGVLSSDEVSIVDLANHPENKVIIEHPAEITDWSEIVTRHRLIAADFGRHAEEEEALAAKLESRNYS